MRLEMGLDADKTTSCFSPALALQGLSHSWGEAVHVRVKMRGSELTGGLRWLAVCRRLSPELPLPNSAALRVQTCSADPLTDLKRASRLCSTLKVTSAVFFEHRFNDPLLGPHCPRCHSTVYLDWCNVFQMERYSQTHCITLASGIIIPYHLQNAFLGSKKSDDQNLQQSSLISGNLDHLGWLWLKDWQHVSVWFEANRITNSWAHPHPQ